MPQQSAVTVLAPLPPEHRDRALAALTELAGPDRGALAFDRLAGLHFARILLLEGDTSPSGAEVGPALLYSADTDGSADDHVRALADVSGNGLDRAFGLCSGYPERSDPAGRAAWLRAHRVPEAAFYVNTAGRGVSQVVAEARLRDGLETYLDDHRDAVAGLAPAQVHAVLRRHALTDPRLRFGTVPARRPPWSWRARELAHAIAVPVLLLPLLPLLLLLLPVAAVVLRLHELRDEPDRTRPDPAAVDRLRAAEDQVAHNAFAAVGHLKPGPFRALLTRGVLVAIGYAVRHVLNRGSLAGVRTIHFARWVYLTPERMVFLSTYDGSLESYMDDFIDKIAWGLNAVFSNGVGYPPTVLLLWRGARQEDLFKDHLRNHQALNHVWWSAYERLTALNVGSNAALRAGLARRSLSDEEARAWLALL
ncbi:hypothetical protein JD79_03387 [Geodermatophilus normandii]|uniref:Peroxidase n=1 Tax=Geodermatophilus normandii TaxID=1137989 RepID=A0A317QMD8_9ACTN|nr:hypothetical protein [Geodermatophilus normandii]PWW24209.1 hypothetical protein JD79_03387 [Geodermatophilus normandii]